MTVEKPKFLSVLDGITFAAVLISTGMVFFYTPMERSMGLVQKVFYFHVAAGWVGMLGFLLSLVAGIVYLRSHKVAWDRVGVAGVEIGLVFTLINVVTGMIWARPIWNTWWTWDPRLTTATIMMLVYVAYLLLRQGIDEPERRMRFGAVYAILGFLSVPLTFLSIRIWRTIHPVVIGNGDPTATGSFSMTPPMALTFTISLVVFSILFADILWHRLRLGKLQDEVEQRKMQVMES
jgi:heme exporter protein C